MRIAGLLRICCLVSMSSLLAASGCFPDPPQCVGDNPCDDEGDGDSEVDETADVADDSEVGDGEEVGEVGADGMDIAPGEVGDADAVDSDGDADTVDSDGDVDVDSEVVDADVAEIPPEVVLPDTLPETEPDTRVDTSSPDTTPDTIPEVDTTPDAEPETEAIQEVDSGPEIVVLDCNDLTCAVDHRECIEGTGAVDAVCGGCLSGYTLVGAQCLAAIQPPTGVTATTDHATDVAVTWNSLVNATGYHVYRCDLASCPGDTGWFALTSTPVTETNYIDDTVTIPALPAAPANLAATRDATSQVKLTWGAVTVAAAQSYRYRVVAIGAAGASPGSQPTQGKVADRPVTGYEINIDSGGWVSGGLAVTYDDFLAPAPTVTAATATATQGTLEGFVRLAASGGTATQGAARFYEVRATTANGPGPTASASGWRSVGALTLQWERSAGASADSFSAIAGATGTSYDDFAAPADGSTRWYRVVASAAGAVSQPSVAVPGSLLNPTSLVPTGVTATSDRSSDVEIRWSPVANASGYYVSRCDVANCTSGSWSALTGVATTAASYIDASVVVPAFPAAPGSVVAGGEADSVVLTWGAAVAPSAKRYSYRVTAVVSGNQGAPSATAVGQVAERPVTSYEVRVDAGNWQSVDKNTFVFTDSNAPAPTLTAPTVTASQGTYVEWVRLTSSGTTATPGALRSLDVRAVTTFGPGPASSASARRTAGQLTYQWERSSGTSASNFSAIANANGANSDDSGAPSDGSVRWYRLVVSALGASPVTSAAVSGMKLGPPTTAPTGVVATNDRDDMVMVTWNALPGATSYQVYRDGTKLTGGTGTTTTSYEDRTITAAASWAAPTALMATTNDTTKVVLGWTAPTRPLGPSASYTVRAVNAAGEGPVSLADMGQKAAPPLLGYEVEVAPVGLGSSWMATGSVNATFTHLDPPKGTITGGTLTTTLGMKRAGVDLTTAGGTVVAAVQVDYRVRGVLPANAYTLSSTSVRGTRAVGTLTRQWQRSSGTANSGFADIAGATGTTYLDTGAPSDGSHRWYQVVLGALGCTSSTVAAAEGWRLSFVAVTGGANFSCALTNDGRVWCWGANDVGQMGRGTKGASIETPNRIDSLSNVVEIDGGTDQICARLANGEVWCWGGNSFGQLGDGTTTDRSSPTQVVGLGGSATSISAADGITVPFTCAALTDKRVQCWGSGGVGQLGNNSTSGSNVPVFVKTAAATSLTGVLEVAANGLSACARTATTVRCWGGGTLGQLGNGAGGDSTLAVLVSGIGAVSEITAGILHMCARISGGAIKCWGYNGFGQLGDGTTTQSLVPVSALSGQSDSIISGSGWTSSLTDGNVLTWGSDVEGELGNGAPLVGSVFAVSAGISSVTSIGGGFVHVCAVIDGGLKCWGDNARGQLGDGTQTVRPAPVTVLLP